MQLPCFCLYVLKLGDFDCPQDVDKEKIKFVVPSSYFKDFVDNKSETEIKDLSPKNQPSLIRINNFKEFIKRLKIELQSMSILESEILIQYKNYINFNN